METVDLGQAFEDHMVQAINKLTAPKAEWPGFKEALRHQIARQKVQLCSFPRCCVFPDLSMLNRLSDAMMSRKL